MNRWWRREMRRMERQRLRRIEQVQRQRELRRARLLERARAARPSFSFRQWLRRPYKPLDLVGLVLLAWMAHALARAAALRLGLPASQAHAYALVVQQLALLGVVWAYLRWLARESPEWLAPGRPGYLGVAAGAVAGGALWLVERGLVALLAPWITLQVPLPPADPSTGAPFAAAVALAPLSDELFYRRWMLALFAHSRMPLSSAVLFSAMLYGLTFATPGAVLLGTLGGLAYGWLYARTGSLLAAVLMHGVHNLLAWRF